MRTIELMDEDLYPPGMAPPRPAASRPAPAKPAAYKPSANKPAAQPAAAKPAPAKPASQIPAIQSTAATGPFEPSSDHEAASDASLFDASQLGEELLPDVGLPPEADIAPDAADLLPAPALPAPTAPIATSASAAAPLKLSTAPRAAQLTRRRDKNSAAMLLLTVTVCVTLLVAAGAAYLQFAGRSSRSKPIAERPPPSPVFSRNSAQQPTTKRRRNPPAVTKTPDWDEPAPELTYPTADNAPPVTSEASVAPMPPTASHSVSPSPPEPPAPAPSPLPQVSQAEIEKLIAALQTAKTALSEQNFSLADAELAKAEALAKLPAHQAAASRLKELASYVKQSHEALSAAAKSMQAGESFQVGTSTLVTFVEAKDDRLILRIAGMNKTYRLDDLPPGLALALIDFKFPPADATTKILKGAYLLVHKRADDETKAKARELWEEAHTGGRDTSHLMPLLTENYGDLIKDATE